MKQLLLSLLIFGFGISGLLGQTIKTLGFNTTNGQVVANTGTNVLTFANALSFGTNAATTRANLGFSTNLNTLWTATNSSNARSAAGLGVTNSPQFTSIIVGAPDQDSIGISAGGITTGSGGISFDPQQLNNSWAVSGAFSWTSNSYAATTRTNLGLGGGITATNSFVSYNGTNYTTNSVTISNGIITGWAP